MSRSSADRPPRGRKATPPAWCGLGWSWRAHSHRLHKHRARGSPQSASISLAEPGVFPFLRAIHPASYVPCALLGMTIGAWVSAASGVIGTVRSGGGHCGSWSLAGFIVALAWGISWPRALSKWVFGLGDGWVRPTTLLRSFLTVVARAFRNDSRNVAPSGVGNGSLVERDLGRENPASLNLVEPQSAEPQRDPLLGSALSVVLLLAGISAALSPIALGAAGSFRDYVLGQFLLGGASLGVFQFILSILSGLVPLGFMGLGASTMFSFADRMGETSAGVMGGLLVGASIGIGAAETVLARETPNLALAIASALPLLGAAILVAATGVGWGRVAMATSAEIILPQWSDRRPAILRAGVVGVVCATTIFAYTAGTRQMAGIDVWHRISSASLTYVMVGFLIATVVSRFLPRSMLGFGGWCVFAGVSMALTALAVSRGDTILGRSTQAFTGLGLGWLLRGGWAVIHARTAVKAPAMTKLLERSLVYSAVTLAFVAPALNACTFPGAASSVIAGFLLLLGGTMILFEPRKARWASPLSLEPAASYSRA